MKSFASSIPLLNLLVLVPTLAAICVGIMGAARVESKLMRIVTVVAMAIVAGLAALLLFAFPTQSVEYQFVTSHAWLKSAGINWKFGVDGISMLLVVLSAFSFPFVLYASRAHENSGSYFAWLLLLEAGCIGAFIALDLFLFFVCFEFTIVPMYFLIGRWGFARRRYAATKFFLFTLAGSVFLLAGIIALAVISANRAGVPITFDLEAIQKAGAFTKSEGRWLFILFAIGFAVKVPIFPLHSWLADTYENAPFSAVIASSAVMVKLGAFGLIRYGIGLFPEAALHFAVPMIALGVVNIVYGAVLAIVQRDLKRLMAYSSLSHLGFVVVGTFVLTTQSVTGAVLQMINHGIISTALFLLIGMIFTRRLKTQIDQFSGLQRFAPWLAAFFMVATMASIGVPGLNGFVGEFLVLLATFNLHQWWASAAATVVVLSAIYLLWAYQRVFHNEAKEQDEKTKDLTLVERCVMAPLIFAIVFLGVHPQPVIDRVVPTAQEIYINATFSSISPGGRLGLDKNNQPNTPKNPQQTKVGAVK